ncbi:uncharacterized protein LOC143889898 [Tasmannia lanceolata]|uniref:uncharacterized protein LOC143889898 n=1 Tax=Tasmannia lanceolata TaxID=3420 RepID=UPI004062E609
MENPSFRNSWNKARPRNSPKEVVSIPIHFFRNENNRSDNAVKIQKVFRGFIVRKNMKKIVGIQREADEIERKMLERETRDEKERDRVNEMLMGLLFRLDSVCGVVDFGVRNCRKGVIRRVIVLQDKLDAVGKEREGDANDRRMENQAMEKRDSVNCLGNFEIIAEYTVNQALEKRDFVNCLGNFEIIDNYTVDQTLKKRDSAHFLGNFELIADYLVNQTLEIQTQEIQDPMAVDQTLEIESPVVNRTLEIQSPVVNQTLEIQMPVVDQTLEIRSPVVDQTLEIQNSVKSAENSEIPIDGIDQTLEIQNYVRRAENREALSNAINQTLKMADYFESKDKINEEGNIGADSMEGTPEILNRTKLAEKYVSESLVEEDKEAREIVGEKGCGLTERMLEEKEELKGLVSELCERNALQCQMINSLAQRVERLERRMKGKKKRQETMSDARKCGRKL